MYSYFSFTSQPLSRPSLQRLRNMKIRLRSTSTLQPVSEGFLEVYARKKWRTMCADGWDMTDSKVVCGMLGFPDAIPISSNL